MSEYEQSGPWLCASEDCPGHWLGQDSCGDPVPVVPAEDPPMYRAEISVEWYGADSAGRKQIEAGVGSLMDRLLAASFVVDPSIDVTFGVALVEAQSPHPPTAEAVASHLAAQFVVPGVRLAHPGSVLRLIVDEEGPDAALQAVLDAVSALGREQDR